MTDQPRTRPTRPRSKTPAAIVADKLNQYLTLPILVDSICLRSVMLEAMNLLDRMPHD